MPTIAASPIAQSSPANSVHKTLKNANNPASVIANSSGIATAGAASNSHTTSGYNNASAQGTGAASQMTGVTQSTDPKSLTSNALNGILTNGSPYLTGARARASQFGNRRGLLNSSMTAGAGEAAAINAALPIAQADAATYGRQSILNQQNQQQAGMVNANAQNANARLNAQLGTGVAQQNAQVATQTQQFNAAQTNAANARNAQFQQQASINNSRLGTQNNQFNAAQINAVSQNNFNQGVRTAQFNAQQGNSFNLAQAAADTQTSQFNAAQTNAVRAKNAESQLRTNIAQLNSSTRTELQAAQNRNSQLLQMSQTAATVLQGGASALAQIFDSANLSGASKSTARDQILDMVNNGFAVADGALSGSVGNLKLTPLPGVLTK